jgi:hypothetical protein
MRDPSAFFAYTKLLERELTRADQGKQRLIQTNADLLRSLNGHKEASSSAPEGCGSGGGAPTALGGT